jgi:hypothetical protein
VNEKERRKTGKERSSLRGTGGRAYEHTNELVFCAGVGYMRAHVFTKVDLGREIDARADSFRVTANGKVMAHRTSNEAKHDDVTKVANRVDDDLLHVLPAIVTGPEFKIRSEVTAWHLRCEKIDS